MAPYPTIKDWVDATNLNTVNWRKTTLRRIATDYKLKPGECVVFENAVREKARLVVNLGGLIVLLIPPIDPARQLSTHLEVNQFLRAFAGSKQTLLDKFSERRKDIQDRLERRKKMKENARRRRAKSKKK